MNALAHRERVSTLPATAQVFARVAAEPSEHALIGAVLLDPGVYANVAELVEPVDFAYLYNGFVWYAIDKLAQRGDAIDIVSVADELDRRKELAGQPHAQTLAAYMAECPTPDGAEGYARRVREAAVKLRTCNAAGKMIELAVNGEHVTGADGFVDECNRLLFEATDQRATDTDTSASALMSTYWQAMEDGMEGKTPAAVPTGFPALDDYLKGLARGEVIVVGGAEGMGKTSWMLSVARNVCKHYKLNVIVFTLEMAQMELMRLFMAMETGIPKDTLKAHALSPFQWAQFVTAAGEIRDWPLHVVDEFPALTPIQLQRRLRRMALQRRFDLVIVDGLWLMEPTLDPEARAPERPRAVGLIMRDLNAIARQFNVPILISHQYNVEAHTRQDKRPKLVDMAESAGVRRNAQVVLGLYRDSYYGITAISDVTELHILKDRNGRAQGRRVEMVFDYNRACFAGLEAGNG